VNDFLDERTRTRGINQPLDNSYIENSLAGYNLDYDIIRTLKEKSGFQQGLYSGNHFRRPNARISRSPKPVNERVKSP
jgi:hypothetical protein